MKKTSIRTVIGFMLLSAAGCDDRYTSLKDFNDAPSITLMAEKGTIPGKELRDSVKLSKAEFAYMPFIIALEDPNANIKAVSYRALAGSGQLIYRNTEITGTVPVIGNRGVYRFVPAGIGNVHLRFVVTDRFDEKDSANLHLYVFDNLPPVAALDVRFVDSGRPLEYLLDAGASYDADRAFGGVVSRYVFTVGAERIETIKPGIPYIFPAPGTYVVRLQVVDNDNVGSKEVTTTVQVK